MLSVLSVLLSFVAWLMPATSHHEEGAAWRLAHMTPAVASTIDGLDVWTLHVDGSQSLVGLTDDGLLAASFGSDSFTGDPVNSAPQGPIGTAPVPVLEATWIDAQGVTHKVTTPIDSSTTAGVDRAFELHEKLVARLQAKHPPRPV